MRVYITDLEAYNNGHLVGRWITLPMDGDLLAECVEDILREGKNICEDGHFHEEYFITDYECDYMTIEEYDNIDELNEIAEAMEEMDEEEKNSIKFLLDMGIVSDIYDTINEKENVRIYKNHTMEDIAYDYIQECYDLENIPEIITNNIDYESIARDMEIEGSFYHIDGDIYEYIG